MKYSSTKKVLYTMILTAMFTALCFAATYVAIPFGTSKVHLGNAVCILAGLLCGPIVGGIAGSLGMGLNDILSPYAYGPDTIIRTFIVKFVLGFIIGLLFRILVKKEKNVKSSFWVFSILFLALFVGAAFIYSLDNHQILFELSTNTYKLSISLPLFITLGIISALFIGVSIFAQKLNKVQQIVLMVTTLGTIINVVLEFFLKIPLKVAYANLTFEQAYYYALASLPSAIFTSVITIFIVTLIYMPLYYATRKFNMMDNLYKNIQNLTSINEEKEEK